MFEFWGVCLFSFCSVKLKMVGNIMELNRFIFSMVYNVILFVLLIDMKIKVIVMVLLNVNIFLLDIFCIIKVLMNWFIIVFF